MTRSLRILAFDDDPTMLGLFSVAFRSRPVHLMRAENEAEAQYFLENEAPDLFLVDLCLGGKNGLETAEKTLRRAGKQVPIIVVTAETGGPLQGYVHSGRCLGYLLKPICLRTFGAEVLSYLDVSKNEKAHFPDNERGFVGSSSLESAFLETALAKIRDFSLRGNSDLLEDDSLARAAHQWIGASGIENLPEVEIEAREVERLARSKDADQIPHIRRLLAEIMDKFEGAAFSLAALERR